MKIHELKIERRFLDDKKRFEIRKDDRNYIVGDLIHFDDVVKHSIDEEVEIATDEIIVYDHTKNNNMFNQIIETSHRYHALFRIIYILRDAQEYGLQSGYCILGLEPVKIEVKK